MKKYLLSLSALFILAGILFSFSSCGNKTQKFTEYSFDYFDTVTTIVGYASTKEEFDTVTEGILGDLSEYHRLYTVYNRFEGLNNLCTVNELTDGVHQTVKVDQKIIDMLLFAKDMYDLTYGTVNVAMGSVLSVWHDYRSEGMDDPV